MKQWCAFCRMPETHSDEELVKRINKRVKLKDVDAIFTLGCQYYHGKMGLSQDKTNGLELWKEAAQRGSISAHNNLGISYYCADGVEQDVEKGIYHFKMATVGGHEEARHNPGCMEERNDNMNRAMKHFMIAAKCGHDNSLTAVGKAYKAGHVKMIMQAHYVHTNAHKMT